MQILGLGVDMVESQRVERLVSRNEDIFRARILGAHERDQIPEQSAKPRRIQAYARAIAGKEAFLKALGTGLTQGMRWPDIEILDADTATPHLAVSGEAARTLAGIKADAIDLSLSSQAAQSLAIVMLIRSEFSL